MTSSVLNLMELAPQYDTQKLTDYSKSLHREILSLSAHRQEALAQISRTITGQFHTGYAMLDSIFHLYQKQAKEFDITLTLEQNTEFFEQIFSYLDEEQLCHILSDMLQNAIVATKCPPERTRYLWH